MCRGGFAKGRGIVGDGVERDAVAARRFHRTRNLVTLGIAEHEGGKGLLQRIARAVLLFESSNRNSVQFHFLSQSSLEDSNGVQLGQRLGPAHLKNRRWVRRLCGHRQSKSDNIVKDRKSTRLNSSHGYISYAVFCLKKKKKQAIQTHTSEC